MKQTHRFLIILGSIVLLGISQCTNWFFVHHHTVSFSEAQKGLQSLNADTLENEIRTLASDQMQGRKTTYPGQKKAARYLASYFRDLGLIPVDPDSDYLQEIPMYRTYLAKAQQAVLITGNDTLQLHYRTQFSIMPRGIAHAENLDAPVVFAGYGIQSDKYKIKDYDSVDVENKWVLVIDGEPQSHDSTSIFDGLEPTSWSSAGVKRWTARRKKALGLIVAGNQIEESQGDSTNSYAAAMKIIQESLKEPAITLRDNHDENHVPIVYVSDSTANLLLQSTGKTILDYQNSMNSNLRSVTTALPVEFSVHINIRRESATAENVAGILPGSDDHLKNEYVALTAHYDHLGVKNDTIIYNGADDNATGTSIVMSNARAFTINPVRPKRSMLFLLVSGEEEGLLGSTYFVKHPLVRLNQMTADINTDMVGRNAPDSIYVIGSNMLSKDLDSFMKLAAQQLPDFYLDYRFDTRDDPHRYYYRSDHYNFAKHDIPVVFFFAGVHKDYHKPTDTADKIEYSKVTNVARLAYLTAWATANYSNELKLNGVLTKKQPSN